MCMFPKIVGFPPKSSIYRDCPLYINHPIWGFWVPLFLKTPIWYTLMPNKSQVSFLSFSPFQRALNPHLAAVASGLPWVDCLLLGYHFLPPRLQGVGGRLRNKVQGCCFCRESDMRKLVGGFSPTHLKNIISSNWIMKPQVGMKIKKYLKPPPRKKREKPLGTLRMKNCDSTLRVWRNHLLYFEKKTRVFKVTKNLDFKNLS